MNYTTDRWSLCLAWAVVACAACCPAMAGPVSPEYVEQQRAVVNAALAQEKPAEEVTYDLIEMLLSEDLFVPRFAAEALKERELSERQMIHLSNIVWMVPFGRDEGCIRILQWTGSDVCSKYAWDVLAHHTLRDLPAEAQVQWLIGQMRTVGASPQRVAWAASSRASKLGAVAVPALIRALEREGTLAQQAAGGALMDIGTTEAQTAVAGWSIHTLEAYDNPLLWQQAALWLGRLGSAAAFEPLERVLWAHLESTHI